MISTTRRFSPITLVYWGCFAASLLFVFRDFVLSGFNLVTGDIADGRIMITLLEHWRAVFNGEDVWGSPKFYYPLRGILGNTDAHALLSAPYILARAFMNEYHAYEVTQIFTRGVGFWCMALFLRSSLRLGHFATILGATIFTVLSPAYLHMIHAQFVNAAYLPLLMYFAFTFCRTDNTKIIWASGIALAVSFPLLALSSFYLAYFSALFVLIAIAVTIVFFVTKAGFYDSWRLIRPWLTKRAPTLVAMAAVAATCMVPWLYLYLPKIEGSGAFSVTAALSDSPRIGDLINAGDTNFIWGSILGPGQRTWMATNPGFPLFFVLLFIGTFISSFFRKMAPSGSNSIDTIVIIAGLSVAVMWILFVKVGQRSLLTALHGILPGASAVRVPARLPLFLGAIDVPILMIGFERIQKFLSARMSWTKYMAAISILAAVLVVEHGQTRTAHHLDVAKDDRILSQIPSPPSYCKSFLTKGISDRPYETWGLIRDYYGPYTDAMLLAYRLKIPTLTGMSSIIPKEWEQIAPWGADYDRTAKAWQSKYRLDGVCEIDLKSRSWSRFAQ